LARSSFYLTPLTDKEKRLKRVFKFHFFFLIEGLYLMFTIGSYLAHRLAQVGAYHVFAVAGDYNLGLLDELLQNESLKQVYCTNELNCGFAAEGYARARGVSAAVVTFGVGALSAFNALAGAYAENLAVVLVSGAPNTNDVNSGNVVHHTLGNTDYSYQFEIAKKLTCAAVVINSASNAPKLIDFAIWEGLRQQKPVYIEIPCNMASVKCAAPSSVSLTRHGNVTDAETLVAAVEAANVFLQKSQRPILLVGPLVRAACAESDVVKLAEALGCGVAVMAAAKSFFPENHPQFVGVYWGKISSPGTQALFDSSDGVICVGTLFNDYSTVGWTAVPEGPNVLFAEKDCVRLAGLNFNQIQLSAFLSALSEKVDKKPATATEYQRNKPRVEEEQPANANSKLTRSEMVRQMRPLITSNTTLFAETGDSWFNSMEFHLPAGAKFEVEMMWGHIGWSVPASFGYALGEPTRRIIGLIGDGSFQVTAQEVAQMIRYQLPVIIILSNNNGYAIEAKIHKGPYNEVKNWDYSGLIEVFNAGKGHGRGMKATNGLELSQAIESALSNLKGPTLIECILDREDCTQSLTSWGKLITEATTRPPL
jgi:pyruvate decarboxylase